MQRGACSRQPVPQGASDRQQWGRAKVVLQPEGAL